MSAREEAGHVTVLALGLTMVVFAVVGLAVDGTKVFLTRRALQNVADGAAVSAASSIDESLYYASGGRSIELDESRAAQTAAEIIARRQVPMDIDLVAENEAVRIIVRSESRTTFLRLIGVDAIDVAASAVAAPFPQISTDG